MTAWQPDRQAAVHVRDVRDAINPLFPWVDGARPLLPPGAVTWMPPQLAATIPPDLPGATLTPVASGVMIDARHPDGTAPDAEQMTALVTAWRERGAFRVP